MNNNTFKRYVLGFIFNEDLEEVLLIHKLRPKWQENLLNGIGGKVEEGEIPYQAIIREIKEECDLNIDLDFLVPIITLQFENCAVDVFAISIDFSDYKSTTDETIICCNVETLRYYSNLVPDLLELIQLSRFEIMKLRYEKLNTKLKVYE